MKEEAGLMQNYHTRSIDQLHLQTQGVIDVLTRQLSAAIADVPAPRTPHTETTTGTQTMATYTSPNYTQTVEPQRNTNGTQTVSPCTDTYSWISLYASEKGATRGSGGGDDGDYPHGVPREK